MQESLSHIKTKKFRSIIHQWLWNLGYMSLNSSWKINLNESILMDWFGQLTKLTQKTKSKNKVLIKPKQALGCS
jgi:hypothetical protein